MPEDKAVEQLKNSLLHLKEGDTVELKKSSDLPSSFWETYSSFSNTNGGLIVLGVYEQKEENEILGVNHPEHILETLWNNFSNPEKVSFRTVNNQDVSTAVIDDKTVVLVHVNEAPDGKKPVYINGKMENSYIRTGDGDRRATKDEIAAFLRNAKPGMDALAADRCTMEDLDDDSILVFKQIVNSRFPKKKYLEMNNLDFLVEIGGCIKNRATNEIEVLRGTLLFFGKVNSIKEYYPHFHLDYFNRKGNNPRWIDRVSDDEPGDVEMNLFNFYRIVDEKLKNLLMDSFKLDENQVRVAPSDFDETIRECLVNCLAHADYAQGYPSLKIEAYDGWFRFFNPGQMLISEEQFRLGGDSRPRNEIVMKMFRLIGASERQGFGGPLIFKAAQRNDFRQPEVDTNLEHTEVRVWDIDLADSYPELTSTEKNALRYITKGRGETSIKNIKEVTKVNDYQTRKALKVLEDKNIITKVGNGSSTRYVLKEGSKEFVTQLQILLDVLKNRA